LTESSPDKEDRAAQGLPFSPVSRDSSEVGRGASLDLLIPIAELNALTETGKRSALPLVKALARRKAYPPRYVSR